MDGAGAWYPEAAIDEKPLVANHASNGQQEQAPGAGCSKAAKPNGADFKSDRVKVVENQFGSHTEQRTEIQHFWLFNRERASGNAGGSTNVVKVLAENWCPPGACEQDPFALMTELDICRGPFGFWACRFSVDA